uniref:Uncharacterized protein n=2 Tax=Lotus japonicus TaxID=34305 RepID=I3SKX9_LOTJA|nr:unknown [Lotus japonicus]
MSNSNRSASGIVHSATVRSSHETKSGTPQQHSRYHDMSQTPAPGVYGPQKQNFNFLSLSVGGTGLKVNNGFNEGRSRLELLSKSQVPYFQSLQQQHGLMPLPTPQSQYASSTSYLDQLPAAGPQVRLQQPHYYGTPLCGTQYSSTASYKQQQQSFWAVQLAANGGSSSVNCNIVRAQYPNWQQNGRVDSCAVSPFAQVISSISQQKPLTLASSLHPSRTIGLDIHLPSVCEESMARFRSSGTPSLQLLCDERL